MTATFLKSFGVLRCVDLLMIARVLEERLRSIIWVKWSLGYVLFGRDDATIHLRNDGHYLPVDKHNVTENAIPQLKSLFIP